TLSRWLSISAVTVMLAVVPAALPAQTIRSTLTGTVTDPNNAVVPKVTVTATNVATNIVTTTRTNDEGQYTFTALAPGEYVIEVAQSGLKRAQSTGVTQ